MMLEAIKCYKPLYTVLVLYNDYQSINDVSIGVNDSSGMEFFYTSTPRQHDGGILMFGA